MLTSLHIKNYALIEELETRFEPGLNIITGETGAGKSIIIDALSLVLGGRADADIVRREADKAVVEATLSVAGHKRLRKLLEEQEIEWNDDLILRREVSAKGGSRSFINDTPCTLALLSEAGDLLVDLHGQHEHQSLLHPHMHIDFLDEYGQLGSLAAEFSESHRVAVSLISEIDKLKQDEQRLMERRDLLQFQIREIDAVQPQEGEEQALASELNVLEHAEKLHSETERLFAILHEGDQAVHDQLVVTRNELEQLSRIDPSFEDAHKEAASAAAIVEELAKFIQQYNSKIEFNPDRLEGIRNRLGQLSLLKKKYGGSLESILAHRAAIGNEADLADHFQEKIGALQEKLEGLRETATSLAIRLSTKRSDVAKKLNKAIEQGLGTLGIAHAVFETKISRQPAPDPEKAIVKQGSASYASTASGIDTVEFFVSTNAGEEPKPLAKVASGGEISRIMLALKMILAKSDRLPLLIFDEIDVGVSGRIAQTVGQSMKKLSEYHQVIAITHLPQIAGLADTHLVVEKSETKGRSFTRLRTLSLEERVEEVARLMSGEEITQTGLRGARELMGVARS